MRGKFIAGNWKMNGTVPETEELLKGLLASKPFPENTTVVVCPPYTSLYVAWKLLKDSPIGLGAQDVSVHHKGAYTAEVSLEMLLTVGVRYVILGHSERRQYHQESDNLVNAKAKLVLEAGLTPIICVGETEAERDIGKTESVVGSQIDGTLSGFTAEMLKKSVVAYEPVWAIGTGKTATPAMAQDVHKFIRDRMAKKDAAAAELVPILYGGSVKADNAEGLLSEPDIDGALVGGACLKSDEFIKIIHAV